MASASLNTSGLEKSPLRRGARKSLSSFHHYLTSKARELVPQQTTGSRQENDRYRFGRRTGHLSSGLLRRRIALDFSSQSRSKRSFNFSKKKVCRVVVFKSLARWRWTRPALTGCFTLCNFFNGAPLSRMRSRKSLARKNYIASNAINALYHKLHTAGNRRVEMFFAQWDMIFGVIYGQELERGDAAGRRTCHTLRHHGQARP